MSFRKIAVFCGANAGHRPVYTLAAQRLADVMSAAQIDLVYGAGSVGLMGVIANQMMINGRHVIGVIPQILMDREVGHTGISDLHVVRDMHERKMMMAELSDAFIAMPGGVGTLEEIIEVFTWNQIGIHNKPCGFLNVNGYYDGLMTFLDHSVNEGFLKVEHRNRIVIDEDPQRLLERLKGESA